MQEIRDLGGQSFLVGAAVRDFLLNQKIQKDLDVDLFGIGLSDLENLLVKALRIWYTVSENEKGNYES